MAALEDPTGVLEARAQQEAIAEAERRAAAERAAAVAAQQPPPTAQVPTGVVTRALGALSGTPIPATTTAPPPAAPAAPAAPAGPPTALPSALQRGLSVVGGVPVAPFTPAPSPPEQPSLNPSITPSPQAAAPSAATQAIVDARTAGTEPAVEGAQPGALGSALKAVVAGALRAPRDQEPGARPYRGTTPPVSEEPVVVQSGAPTAAPTSGTLATIKPKGAAGGAQPPATRGRAREELPDALPKAAISPTYLVELEKSNPALHDGIIQAAQAAGIGSWDYANLIYASSRGDPNYNAGGRVGLAGLSQQDIDRYQKERPELFRNSKGEPVTAQDPHTSLMLGALKYREMRDNYGAKTPMSILAYHLGQEKVDALARVNSTAQQQAMLPPNADQLVQQSISGPDAGKPYVTPTPVTLNPPGTATPMATYQAAAQAAKTGNAMPFIAYAVKSVPRGMGGTDAWRYLENQGVAAMMRTGNVEGAQHVRELIFQMSHVGSNQALMSAYKHMRMGDYHGSAQQLALAYWAAPDGGLAQFAVGKGKDGKPMMIGRRYNEDTHNPVGEPFEVTPERLIDMMNITRDPNQFAKVLRDNQKMHSEIASKEADTSLKIAHADYYKNLLPSLEQRAKETQSAASLAAASRALTAEAKGAGKPPPVDIRVAHVDKAADDFFKIVDPVTQQRRVLPPEEAFQHDIVKNMMLHNDSMSVSAAADYAADLVKNPTGGLYEVRPNSVKQGWGIVRNRKTGAVVGELDPYAAQRFVARQPAKPAAAPGLGAR